MPEDYDISRDIAPGDVILHNDVFSGGNQNADVAIFKPIFHNGALFAWAAVKGHQADIGGAVAGGYNPDAREVWQEALRITPVKVVEKGKLRRDVWDLIFANIRYPIVAEDIKAQIGACAVGERLVHSLLQRYGLTHLLRDADLGFYLDSTEKMVRAEIRADPRRAGIEGESWMHYDGIHSGYEIQDNPPTITVKGDEIYFDYSGTNHQTRRALPTLRCGASMSAVILTLLMFIDPDIPHNDGIYEAIARLQPGGNFSECKHFRPPPPSATASPAPMPMRF